MHLYAILKYIYIRINETKVKASSEPDTGYLLVVPSRLEYSFVL